MLQVNNVSLQFGGRKLFEDVNLKFTKGNCYGIIGANGAGKSTFLRILSGDLSPNKGEVVVSPKERMSVLNQNQEAFNDVTVLNTVLMGHKRLIEVMNEKDAIYAKPDFNEADGMKAAELEAEFMEMNGWEAESDAQTLLNGLGVPEELSNKLMGEIEPKIKVKVLLAQALFGNPDILILDEPTNNLDAVTTKWLEDYLIDFENILIIVSHNRHFLNRVCTHICDVDYGKINLYVGNYDFWYETSQLLLRQQKEQNKKAEARAKELQEFISRFSANASKSKQATSRKKELEKLTIDDIKPSSRKYPYIDFKPDREQGKEVLEVKNISKTINGEKILDNISFTVKREDKISLLSDNEIAKTVLFQILAGEMEPDEGELVWGTTISKDYFPKDNNYMFNQDVSITDWLRQYSKDPDETYVRSFLGRMLFSGEEALKKVEVLSGGEKVRCVLSKLMLSGANFLIFDEPTNHLDMESITALNDGMQKYKGIIMFTSHDHQLTQTVANKIIDITNNQVIVRECTYDEYLEEQENV